MLGGSREDEGLGISISLPDFGDFGEGKVGFFDFRRCGSSRDADPTPAFPEVGEFSGMGFPEMEVGSWKWISC
jgi:hypothetical protein